MILLGNDFEEVDFILICEGINLQFSVKTNDFDMTCRRM
jgi:hypothetical protein